MFGKFAILSIYEESAAARFTRISLMLQKEIPTAMRPLATASSSSSSSSSSSVYQKIERFSSTIACVKTTELLLKVWIMSQTTTEIWSSFFGEKKERKWNCVPRELTVDEQLLLPRLISQTLRLLPPFFLVTSQSSSRASSLSLPSFLPSFLPSLLPSLHCTAEGRLRSQTPLSPSIYHIHRVPERYPPGIKLSVFLIFFLNFFPPK